MNKVNHNIEELLTKSGIERLELPMPKNALGHVNVYFIRQNDHVWIIDSGMRAPEHQALIKEKIDSYTVDGTKIDALIITHYHPDHIGWTGWVKDYTGCKFYMSEKEWFMGRWLATDKTDDYLEIVRSFYYMHGFDDEIAALCTSYFEASRPSFPPLPSREKTLKQGHQIALVENNYDVFTVTGHSPEHVCLYDRDNNILFSIDAVLEFVTPNVSTWAFSPHDNPLQSFKEDLERLGQALEEDCLVLPGHGKPFFNGKKRIREILKHHERREDKILKILSYSDHALSIADFIKDIYNREFSCIDWVFGIGEAYSHLNYLESTNKIERVEQKTKESTIVQWASL